MIMLQNYTVTVQKSILMNTSLFQILRKELGNKYNPLNLFLETYNYDIQFENEELSDTTKSDKEASDLPSISVPKVDEVKDFQYYQH